MIFESRVREVICLLIVISLLLSVALACAAPAGKQATIAPTGAAPSAATPAPAKAEATATPKPAEKAAPIAAATGEPKRGGTLRTAEVKDPPAWDPH